MVLQPDRFMWSPHGVYEYYIQGIAMLIDNQSQPPPLGISYYNSGPLCVEVIASTSSTSWADASVQ